jgi:DNA-binding transcriptional MerR regulator
MNSSTTPPQDELHSIGDVAEVTGISVDAIRVWERRYGRPVPVRLPSGHRRYTDDHVRWLRRIAEALAHGFRPSKVVKLGDEELDELLGGTDPAPGDSDRIERLLGLVQLYAKSDLEVALLDLADRLGPRDFLGEIVAPLLVATGRRWADGEMEIRHEHFLTSLLEDLLRTLRMRASETSRGRVFLLATLPGELHTLGIQMAALVATLVGMRPRILGADCPLDEIVSAAEEVEAAAVGISVSLANGGVATDRVLAELRAALPTGIPLIVGGQGARGVRRGPRGIDYVAGLDELEQRLTRLV